jgi:hypothetical protein
LNDLVPHLSELADKINAEHQQAETALRAGLGHAKNAGELLIEAKRQCRHGEWLPWLKKNVHFSERTAQAYIRVAKRWSELETKAQGLADLTFEDGLKLLAAPKEEGQGCRVSEPREIAIADILIPARRMRPYREDGMGALANSLSRFGLIHPIILRRSGDSLILVCGVRRLRAAERIGWPTIRAKILDVDADQARLMEIDENLQCRDVTELERAILASARVRLLKGLPIEE